MVYMSAYELKYTVEREVRKNIFSVSRGCKSSSDGRVMSQVRENDPKHTGSFLVFLYPETTVYVFTMDVMEFNRTKN
jgi:hypothetical protein